jgi:two-component system sensor histidine kinase UhpB
MNSLLKEKLINLPIFYKILVANTGIIVVGAVVGTWLTRELSWRSAPEQLITIFIMMGIIMSILMNFLILKAALQPLVTLQKTVEAVYRGDLTARVAKIPMGDPLITRFRDALNSMLDELSSSHKQLGELSRRLRQREEERGDLLGKIITAQEEERRRVARELHDEVSQTLTGLVMSLGSAEALLVCDSAVRQRLESLRGLTSEAVEEVRRLIQDLRPSLLDDLGLVVAIGWYIENYLAPAGVKAELETQGFDRRLPPNVEITLFRVVQEAITNIIKHAQAKIVCIRLQHTHSAIVGDIEDDGVGFNVDTLYRERRRGMTVGLLGMEERISLLGGKLNIESQSGGGAHVHFEVPWQESIDEKNSCSYS